MKSAREKVESTYVSNDKNIRNYDRGLGKPYADTSMLTLKYYRDMFYYLYVSYATEKVRWNRQQSRNK
jgi:hypothetical protein